MRCEERRAGPWGIVDRRRSRLRELGLTSRTIQTLEAELRNDAEVRCLSGKGRLRHGPRS